MSSEHNSANILLFPARALVLLLYQSQAQRCRGVVPRQCPPDTVRIYLFKNDRLETYL